MARLGLGRPAIRLATHGHLLPTPGGMTLTASRTYVRLLYAAVGLAARTMGYAN